jgi:nucleotide-binding universal stress UspA family protein
MADHGLCEPTVQGRKLIGAASIQQLRMVLPRKEVLMSTPDPAHIVVGVDGSEPSQQALIWAVRHAALLGAEVDAVICWNLPAMGAGWTAYPSDWNPAADAKVLLAKTVTDVFGTEVPPTLHQFVREGNAAQVLLEETKDAELLVVGSRGHGGFAGLLLGSVSANCAEHAKCPVVVVHGEVQK